MKAPPIFLGIIILFVSGAAFGQVVIKEKPLTWQQVALTDGADLYVELCAVCHGVSGMGNGPAAAALKKAVPDLTGLAARNNGKFPRKEVEDSIAGKSRVVAHGTVDMPIWGQAFFNVRPDIKMHRRYAIMRQRVFNLTEYLETIQAT